MPTRKHWAPREDDLLVTWGACLGFPGAHAFVAEHDLNRSANAGRRRIAWLRESRPDFVVALEKQALAERETA
jgi:hypothetical protein